MWQSVVCPVRQSAYKWCNFGARQHGLLSAQCRRVSIFVTKSIWVKTWQTSTATSLSLCTNRYLHLIICILYIHKNIYSYAIGYLNTADSSAVGLHITIRPVVLENVLIIYFMSLVCIEWVNEGWMDHGCTFHIIVVKHWKWYTCKE